MNFFSLKTIGCFFLFLTVILCSCLTPRKIDKWTTAYYGTAVNSKIKSNDYISIKAPGTHNDIVSVTEKRKMKLIPALFYWQWEYGTTTTLNQLVPANYFSSTIIPYANAKKLKDKLNGQKLELIINNVPTVFSIVDKGGLVFLVLYYIDWDRIFMDPQKQDMIIEYRLLKENVETKKGTVIIADRNKPLNVKVFHSVKKTFWSYLDQYNANVQAMSKEAIDKLIAEL
jgi:hypothetical protein